ncbi:hypothetical protein XHV734_2777 [Xanthomonas hortorum pv. vitians]|nr:hypothetical protein XHV734_1226 [Xanthomonas hortorum pv. vitians]QNM60757.1 hypothetical protein XHV734_1963 [Xanthomonas hortorum pv. vitians]QNM61532.1 hypothetical protein XHV734_2777 [Xanthomonas hortorum pv. vitians]
MPSSRQTSLTWRPPSTCFSVATIWLSVNLLLRMVVSLVASVPETSSYGWINFTGG